MSGAAPNGSRASSHDGSLLSSSPAHVARQKNSSSSLSSQLSAHLAKPVAPRTAPALAPTTDSPVLPSDRRALVGVQQSGKAVASAADAEDLSASDLWKSNAAKRAEKAWALQSEKSLQTDPKFKRYTASVEKTLATFESVSEWADFIAFLGRLLKTLQLSTHFNTIPRKLIVAKRLSQCLNPALPSGVHQRALDVYEHILTVIGSEGLRRDLHIWTPGLLPFFQYASTSVKPIVLGIFERHYLALKQDLRPVARAFLLAVLPGLEEETNEFFDRVIRLLDRTRDSVGQPVFLQNMCLALIGTPNARLPALNYLARRLPRLNGDGAKDGAAEVSSIMGSDLGLFVRGFAAALEDETTLLVRRAALDILVTHLRLDSATWKELVGESDKIRLIKAALAVVLRRDLSLNRRLYAWILGPSDDIPVQQKYFEEHAQQLSRYALQSELVRKPLVEVDEQRREQEGVERQRPFKIFVSLLDKWSIGQPLTNVLVIDYFRSLQRQLAGADDEGQVGKASLKVAATDISTTAKMLFEVIDPFATYRQFYYAIREEMSAGVHPPTSAILLLRFVLKSFRVHDEESRQIHLPVLLSIILELLDACNDEHVMANAIDLAVDLLNLIPKRIFIRLEGQARIETSFVQHANSFYEADSYHADEAAQRYIGFQHALTQEKLLALSADIPSNVETQTRSLILLAKLLRVLDSTADAAKEHVQERVPWKAHDWVCSTLGRLQTVQQFESIEAYVSAYIEGAKTRVLQKAVWLGAPDIANMVFEKLFVFLQTQWSPYHVRTVELLWSVADLARGRHLETLLCRGLTSTAADKRRQTADMFGTIWQYSSEERLASLPVIEPYLQVLDGLRSADWNEKQASEKWLRANLRGYTLFLDPLMRTIAEAGLRRVVHPFQYNNRSFNFYQYQGSCDHEKVFYALNVMLQLARFGGQGFVKSMRSTPIRRSPFQAVKAAFEAELDSTYLHALLTWLLLFIRSDPSPKNPYAQAYSTMHTLAAELLHTLISRGPLQGSWLTDVEGALLERIYVNIQQGAVTTQASLLQALYAVVRAKTSEGTLRDNAPHPLLYAGIKDAISKQSNRPVLSSWTDFVLNVVPHYREALGSLLLPLNDTVCQLLVVAIADLQSSFFGESSRGTTEADLILLMNINERLLLQCLESADSLVEAAPTITSSSESADPSGLMSAIGSVFQSDGVSKNPTPTALPSNSILRTVHHTIRSLHTVWTASSETAPTKRAGQARQRSLEVINPRIKSRCRRSLEKIYRNNSGEVVESLVDCWNLAGGSRKLQWQGLNEPALLPSLGLDDRGMEVTFEILSTLAPSAQIVVTFLCDVISTRTSSAASSGGEKATGKKAFTPIVSDAVLLSFWEAYLDRLDSAASMQVWPVVIMLVRDMIHNSTAHKAHMYPVLRCFTVTGEKIAAAAGGNEDKRMKRELVDNYLKLCDLNILIAGKSFEQTNWIGRKAHAVDDSERDTEGRATPTIDEKMSASLPDMSLSGPSVIESINEYLCARALPALRKFSVDQDKALTICTNVVYYIVTPALRQKRKSLEVPSTILRLLTEITRLPGTLRAWKNAVADVFQDVRFFQMSAEAGRQWQPVVSALMNSDKERFVELVGRVTSTPSTNIFTNKEAETLSRATNLRRLTYVIYAAEKDHWLTHLPALQEKLVDLLRNGSSDPVGSEVYLCLRVLLLRFSPRHLSAFWPVIITELMRLLEGCLEEMPSDHSDVLQLVYSASKFLDLLLTLQTDDFQIHQWLFITDTVDIVYPPLDWISDSLLDRIAVLLSEKQSGTSRAHTSRKVPKAQRHVDSSNGQDDGDVAPAKRRPLLRQMGATVATIETLQPFFSSISASAFQATYNCGDAIDWQAVNDSLEADLFGQEE